MTQSVDIKNLLDTYDFPCTLPSGVQLKIKPLTTGQMKKILAYENESNPSVVEEALDELIASCVVSEGFDIDDLYLQDRFFLLMEIRKVSKGSGYGFNFNCPVCSIENIRRVDLSALNVRPFNEDIETNSVVEVNGNLKFELGFPTRRDQKQAELYIQQTVNTTNHQVRMAHMMTATIASSIKNVYSGDNVVENVPLDDKIYILDNIPTETFNKFTQWFEDNDFGVEFKMDVNCSHCDYKSTMEIPLSDFFG